jgi:hypothetical protein
VAFYLCWNIPNLARSAFDNGGQPRQRIVSEISTYAEVFEREIGTTATALQFRDPIKGLAFSAGATRPEARDQMSFVRVIRRLIANLVLHKKKIKKF